MTVIFLVICLDQPPHWNWSCVYNIIIIRRKRRKFITRTQSSIKHESEAQTVARWPDGECYLLMRSAMRWDLRWHLKLYREEQFLMEVGIEYKWYKCDSVCRFAFFLILPSALTTLSLSKSQYDFVVLLLYFMCNWCVLKTIIWYFYLCQLWQSAAAGWGCGYGCVYCRG